MRLETQSVSRRGTGIETEEGEETKPQRDLCAMSKILPFNSRYEGKPFKDFEQFSSMI